MSSCSKDGCGAMIAQKLRNFKKVGGRHNVLVICLVPSIWCPFVTELPRATLWQRVTKEHQMQFVLFAVGVVYLVLLSCGPAYTSQTPRKPVIDNL